MKIFFSVGEPSGDLHGANLIRELKQRAPGVECVGYGGPRMEAAGCRLHTDLTRLAVMWIFRVLVNLHEFWGLVSRADRYFRHHRPDAVVLIDYPGFNWWIARRAKAHGIPVFYYGVPQLWAWAPWRVRKMRRLIDHALCKLPFEEKWFRDRGVNAVYVGHPYFDEVRSRTLDASFVRDFGGRGGRLVTILPGSRTQEVKSNLPWLLSAARRIRQQVPDVRFAIASFNEKQAALAKSAVLQSGLSAEVFVRRTGELIHLAECCLAVSGSVSLELLYYTKPTVILYRVGRVMFRLLYWLGALKVKFITLVNLLSVEEPFAQRPQVFDPAAPGADNVPFPEYPTFEDKSSQLANHIIEWLTDANELRRRVGMLESLKERYASGGACSRAAEYLLARLEPRRVPVPRPHFGASRLVRARKP